MQARLNGVYRETPDHGTSNCIFEIHLSKRNGTLLLEKLNLPSLQVVADLKVEGAFYTLCKPLRGGSWRIACPTWQDVQRRC